MIANRKTQKASNYSKIIASEYKNIKFVKKTYTWTKEENEILEQLLPDFYKRKISLSQIANNISTKSANQVRSRINKSGYRYKRKFASHVDKKERTSFLKMLKEYAELKKGEAIGGIKLIKCVDSFGENEILIEASLLEFLHDCQKTGVKENVEGNITLHAEEMNFKFALQMDYRRLQIKKELRDDKNGEDKINMLTNNPILNHLGSEEGINENFIQLNKYLRFASTDETRSVNEIPDCHSEMNFGLKTQGNLIYLIEGECPKQKDNVINDVNLHSAELYHRHYENADEGFNKYDFNSSYLTLNNPSEEMSEFEASIQLVKSNAPSIPNEDYFRIERDL